MVKLGQVSCRKYAWHLGLSLLNANHGESDVMLAIMFRHAPWLQCHSCWILLNTTNTNGLHTIACHSLLVLRINASQEKDHQTSFNLWHLGHMVTFLMGLTWSTQENELKCPVGISTWWARIEFSNKDEIICTQLDVNNFGTVAFHSLPETVIVASH